MGLTLFVVGRGWSVLSELAGQDESVTSLPFKSDLPTCRRRVHYLSRGT